MSAPEPSRRDGAATSGRWSDRLILRWVGWLRRRAGAVALFYLLLSAALFSYAVSHLTIHTDTADMLSERLPWRQDFIDFERRFPQFRDQLLVLIEASAPEQADQAAAQLAAALAAQPERFVDVYRPSGGPFFDRHGLLYLEPQPLRARLERLARQLPLLQSLAAEPALPRVLALLSQSMEEPGRGSREPSPLLAAVGEAFRATAEGRFYRLSWQRLGAEPRLPAAPSVRLLQVRPRLDFGLLQPARPALDQIRHSAAQLQLVPEQGVRIRLTGELAMMDQELETLASGSLWVTALALACVTLILWLALGTLRLVLIALATLIAGLTATAAFAALAVGALNLISVAFAVLYIGLSIDATIHFSLRYRELLRRSRGDAFAALARCTQDMGPSLLLCSLTTAVGFFAFYPTAFDGVSELGLISGVGMLISLVVNLSLLPALLSRAALAAPNRRRRSEAAPRIGWYTRPYQLLLPGLLVMLALLVLLALSRLGDVRFDDNPLNLRDPDSESVQAFRSLMQQPALSPLTLSLVETDAARAAGLARVLRQLPAVREVLMLDDFVPDGQARKLQLISHTKQRIAASVAAQPVAPALNVGDPLALTPQVALAHFEARLNSASVGDSAALLAAVRQFRATLVARSAAEQSERLLALERALLATLPHNLARLQRSLQAEAVAVSGLPPRLVADWRDAEGALRLEIHGQEDISDPAAAARLLAAVQPLAPGVTGLPRVYLEAGRAVVEAFVQAFLTALALIALLLLGVFRRLRPVLWVLGPILLAALLTAASTVWLRTPFNFANIIALPLLLGIGVDNGIHLVQRWRHSGRGGVDLLRTSTARAVLFSTLTTVASFGNLAFSPHPGTASMGLLLTLGMLIVLTCTLLLLPALMGRRATAEGGPGAI